MNTTTMNRLLIETTVRHTLERLSESPEREIRNLIDMGLEFSEGRFQTHIFKTAQTMLQNPDSAYYTLVKHVAAQIPNDRLLHIGMNIGYESFTQGAATIRSIEATEHHNIPWALSLSLNTEKDSTCYESVLNQCTELGIYTILLIATEDPKAAIPLLKSHSQMAFALFTKSACITAELLQALDDIDNVIICVTDDEALTSACEKLYDAHMLYGIYRLYNDETISTVTTESWLDHLKHYQPMFAVLVADSNCSKSASNEVYTYTKHIREGQHYPFIMIALQQDLEYIDHIISDDCCMAGFDQHGTLYTIDGRSSNPHHNIFDYPLADILKDAFKK